MQGATFLLLLVGAEACTRATPVEPSSAPNEPVRVESRSEAPEDPGSSPSSAVPSTPAPAGDSIVVAYACDEKYAEPGRCAAASDEYRVWLSSAPPTSGARSEGSRRTLQGGGPEGAEWNPSNDWVLFVRKGGDEASLVVGKTTIQNPEAAAAGWIAFRIPERDWKAAARHATRKDVGVPPALVSSLSIVDLTVRTGARSETVTVWSMYGE